MRIAVKITLNSADVFDAVILDYLNEKKNKAGHLKKIVYDSIMRTLKDDAVKQAGAPAAEDPIQNEEEKVVNEKLSKILSY